MEARPPLKVVAIQPEPTPYRSPLFDRIAALEGLDLLVAYAANTVASRTWGVQIRHPAVVLRGLSVPGAHRVLRHDYPITPGIVALLQRQRPDCVVVSGWSVFAAQAAIAWCRVRGVPYVLVVESHDYGRRSAWRRAVKGAIVPRVVRGAEGVLVTGSLARTSMVAYGVAPNRVRVFANTVDVDAFGQRADELLGRRPALRERLGLEADDVVILCVARLAPEKGLDTLVRAVAASGDPRLALVVVGDGPTRGDLLQLAGRLGARLRLVGDLPWEKVSEYYVAADVFALLSRHEPWGVVVNEAAACGLPLVLSDAVGAAHDLVTELENGVVVSPGDVDAAALALRELASDPARRRRWGEASRRIAAGWGYEPSVAGFVEVIDLAVGERCRERTD